MSFNLLKSSFDSKEEAEYSNKVRQNTNSRYSRFNQYYFTAGDKNQFICNLHYRPLMGQPTISLEQNKFRDLPILENLTWESYKSLTPDSLMNTFNYIFDNYKKAIFVSIRNNKVVTFLPFSNANYKNTWHQHIQFSMQDVYKCIQIASNQEGRRFNQKYINRNIDQWYSNNPLIRYEFPINEGDGGVQQIIDMLMTLCNNRVVPDIDFFVNKRDFPLLKYTGEEAYEEIDVKDPNLRLTCGPSDIKYMPILSMTTTMSHADIPIPTWEDWTRIASQEHKKYFSKPIRDYNYNFEMDWERKKPTAVFRGASTGRGITTSTNMRLKIATISHRLNNPDFLDAGITKWNMRPRLSVDPKTQKIDINTINVNKLEFGLVNELTPEEQSTYRYIVNIDGHSAAYRLSLELGMGSVILKVDSEYRIWFSRYLKPWVHYIPVAADLSDLLEQIEWAQQHDKECQIIAQNAKEFYDKYLCKDGVLDYLQWLLTSMNDVSGIPYIDPNNVTKISVNKTDTISRELQPILCNENFDFNNNLFLPDNVSYQVFDSLSRILTFMFTELIGNKNITQYLNYIFDNNTVIEDTKNNIITLHKINQHDKIVLSKLLKTFDTEKVNEIIHSFNAGIVLNKIIVFCQNFAYTIAIIQKSAKDSIKNIEHCIIQQSINGMSFLKWLESSEFKIHEYYSIILQISLALYISYKHCGFIHNDLCPWNIVLKKTEQPVLIEYRYSGKLFTFKTKLIPVIIDYGKCNIVIDDYYHRTNKNAIELQDIITLLVSSSYIILSKQRLDRSSSIKFIKFMNYISGGTYTDCKKFTSLNDIKKFVYIAKKYDNLINSDKGNLSNKSINSFINLMLVEFYDDVYISSKGTKNPIINIDNIILVNNKSDYSKCKKVIKNITDRLHSFLQKDIQFTKQTNCLQFVKYYQNMYKSIEYFEYLISNCHTQDRNLDHNDIATAQQFINHSKEKLVNEWKKQSPTFLVLKKFVQPSVFIPIFPNITSNIELTNIDKAFTLLSKYDFNIYKKITYNKLLLHTFEECKYFDPPYDGLFVLPTSFRKYYHHIMVNSESCPLLTDISLHDKSDAGKTINCEDYNISLQYINIIRDKSLLKDLLLQLTNYKTYLNNAISLYTLSEKNPNKVIDFTYNEKLLEFGNMVRDIIIKHNIM